jgi:hypothetical protein
VYCKRHKDSRESCLTKPFRYFLNLLPFNNLLRTTATLRTKKSNKTKDLDTTSNTDINNNLQDTSGAGDQHSVSRFKNRIKKVQANASLDDQSIMDELNSTCVMCLAEDSSIGNDLLLSCEKIYSSQPAMMFKYHIGMCFFIFISISLVLFISELKKYVFFYKYLNSKIIYEIYFRIFLYYVTVCFGLCVFSLSFFLSIKSLPKVKDKIINFIRFLIKFFFN